MTTKPLQKIGQNKKAYIQLKKHNIYVNNTDHLKENGMRIQ